MILPTPEQYDSTRDSLMLRHLYEALLRQRRAEQRVLDGRHALAMKGQKCRFLLKCQESARGFI
jgi:hypothetical protein